MSVKLEAIWYSYPTKNAAFNLVSKLVEYTIACTITLARFDHTCMHGPIILLLSLLIESTDSMIILTWFVILTSALFFRSSFIISVKPFCVARCRAACVPILINCVHKSFIVTAL